MAMEHIGYTVYVPTLCNRIVKRIYSDIRKNNSNDLAKGNWCDIL